jgi:AraC-like DNA-binding protein
MTTSPKRARTFTHAHRQRLDRAAAHYLRDCYRRSTAARVSEFATYLRRNADYLSRIGPQILGMPLRKFLRGKQLEYAEQLLATTPLDVQEIARRTGFGTNSTFYRCFRERHDLTPLQYREVRRCETNPVPR